MFTSWLVFCLGGWSYAKLHKIGGLSPVTVLPALQSLFKRFLLIPPTLKGFSLIRSRELKSLYFIFEN